MPVSAMTVDESFTEGTYIGTAEGYGGPVSVTVTLGANHKITDLQANGEKETPAYWEKAQELLDIIKENIHNLKKYTYTYRCNN